MTTFTLLASPLVGPAVWQPVADLLRGAGHAVVAPTPAGASSPEDVLAGFLAGTPGDRPCVLVPHSNAGLYVAALTAQRPVESVVFVDAVLPSDEPTTPTATPDFRGFLADLADDDGLLPPWSQWWCEEDTSTLYPDERTRTVVEAEQRRLRLSYFDAAVPTPPGWQALPMAYLAFGETYAAEVSVARQRGWPVEVLAGEHLHQLVEPEAVADSLVRLLVESGALPTEN